MLTIGQNGGPKKHAKFSLLNKNAMFLQSNTSTLNKCVSL